MRAPPRSTDAADALPHALAVGNGRLYWPVSRQVGSRWGVCAPLAAPLTAEAGRQRPRPPHHCTPISVPEPGRFAIPTTDPPHHTQGSSISGVGLSRRRAHAAEFCVWPPRGCGPDPDLRAVRGSAAESLAPEFVRIPPENAQATARKHTRCMYASAAVAADASQVARMALNSGRKGRTGDEVRVAFFHVAPFVVRTTTARFVGTRAPNGTRPARTRRTLVLHVAARN